MNEEDLDDLDRAILDYFTKNRNTGGPWGYGTPAVVREALQEEGHDVPARQTINTRMVRMALAGHLKNLYNKGEYVFVNDPREQGKEEANQDN